MKPPPERRLLVVTRLGEDGNGILEPSNIDEMLETLCHRADRLVTDRHTCEHLRPAFRSFVYSIVDYFDLSGELDDYVLTNILTALATADCHGQSDDGVEEFSTFIRRPNPTDPDTDKYFVVGRAGTIRDSGCPLTQFEQVDAESSEIPAARLHMFRAFHFARSMDSTRDAPRIAVHDLRALIPDDIKANPVLMEAFLDVCFSDGAWELYQRKLAA